MDYPHYLLAERGLSLSDNAPIQPGETKDIAVTSQDARWDTERLSGLANDVDSSFAGVISFSTPSGTSYRTEVGGGVITQGEGTTQKQPPDRTLNIYYATNRDADQSGIRLNYTSKSADKLSFGIMQVHVPDNHRKGQVEYDPNFKLMSIQFKRDDLIEQEYMQHNFVIRGMVPLERSAFIALLGEDNRDTALVFVHGYNNSFSNGAFRLAQIVWDGQLWGSIPVLFS